MMDLVWVKATVGVVAAVASLRFGVGIYFWRQTEALERPTYRVLQKLSDGVEIRRYEPYLIAEYEVPFVGQMDTAGSKGFGKCAGYIFGKNKKRTPLMQRIASSSSKNADKTQALASSSSSENMAMTAPVRIAESARSTKISFVMGSKYTSVDSLPIPLDRDVKLRKVPPHTLAVRSFPGPPPKQARIDAEKERLQLALNKAGMSVSDQSTTLVYGYHDPFVTPSFLRRNEVALLVDGTLQ